MLRRDGSDSNYHPLTSLLALADEKDAIITDKISIHRTIAKYVESEVKSADFIAGAGDKIPNLNINIG